MSKLNGSEMVQTKEIKPATGVAEWAQYSVNVMNGCENDCKYCFAKCLAVRMQRATPKSWSRPSIRQTALEKSYNKRDGRIMFPSSHDITDQNIEPCLETLKKMLVAGNEILIVSKPRLSCIKRLCSELADYRDQILFRFTIGSVDNKILKFWEPNAPTYQERVKCLNWAQKQGFETSVSCEPMLDLHIDRVIEAVKPYVTDAIWLGRVNRLRQTIALNCPNHAPTKKATDILLAEQTDEYLVALYDQYKSDPVIRFKDSISKAIAKLRPNAKGFEQWRKKGNIENMKREKVIKIYQQAKNLGKIGNDKKTTP